MASRPTTSQASGLGAQADAHARLDPPTAGSVARRGLLGVRGHWGPARDFDANREEYSPYGETTFGSFARKRYRYTRRERDEESGLYYHGARYYAPLDRPLDRAGSRRRRRWSEPPLVRARQPGGTHRSDPHPVPGLQAARHKGPPLRAGNDGHRRAEARERARHLSRRGACPGHRRQQPRVPRPVHQPLHQAPGHRPARARCARRCRWPTTPPRWSPGASAR